MKMIMTLIPLRVKIGVRHQNPMMMRVMNLNFRTEKEVL
jgi:hypothetical protein